jgi:hypothetical protein
MTTLTDFAKAAWRPVLTCLVIGALQAFPDYLTNHESVTNSLVDGAYMTVKAAAGMLLVGGAAVGVSRAVAPKAPKP